MEQPDWQDPTAGGAMVRGALWLVQVIGEGSTFTKTQLREAFPGVARIYIHFLYIKKLMRNTAVFFISFV